jgi:hypothetical protein
MIPLPSQKNWQRVLPIYSAIISLLSLSIELHLIWDFLPEWFPIFTSSLENFLVNISSFLMLNLCGIPVVILTITGLIIQIILLAKQLIMKRFSRAGILIFGILALSASSLPWFFHEEINDRLIQYALPRYTPVIEAIEKYKANNGKYPDTLNTLVPEYLPSSPGIYMKFGEELAYKPDSPRDFENLPFIFQISGSAGGSFSGQRFLYCPVPIDTCQESHYNSSAGLNIIRVNEWWLWIYSPW